MTHHSVAFPLFRFYLTRAMHVQRLPESAERIVATLVPSKMSSEESEAMTRIQAVRDDLAHRNERIAMTDFGSGEGGLRSLFSSRKGPRDRSISSIHRTSSVPRHWGLVLFELVRHLKPLSVVELGANLGVSAMYIQAALDLNGNGSQFTTIEGDPTLATIARESVGRLSTSHFRVVNGRFQDVLPDVLRDLAPVQLAFVDGHHEEAAMVSYYRMMRPHLDGFSVVVFDDLYPWNTGLRRAWRRILREESDAVGVDFAKLGVLIHGVPPEERQ
ncbi:MAG TPA: class I SAM-dependent methyltransferase [Bacteroidota bacterium]|nr:class I SAM-dependent methyltransferase [Bacteroidota bacterium]